MSIMTKNFSVNHKSLPEECKVFLDCIDILEESPETDLDSLIRKLEGEKQLQELFIKREDTLPFCNKKEQRLHEETKDVLLENHLRLTNAIKFFTEHFTNK